MTQLQELDMDLIVSHTIVLMDPEIPEMLPTEDEIRFVFEDPLQPTSINGRRQTGYTIPPTEEQWQSCRLACGLASPQTMLNKIKNLESLYQRELKNWEKVIVVAVAAVDLDREQNEDNLKYGKAYDSRMSSITYRKDRAAVLNLIKLLDRVYNSLEHRAFELLIIWDISLTKLRKWTSRTFEEFLSGLPEIPFRPMKEEQASLALYIPFLVHLLRPQYTLDVIQKALKTRTLTQRDLDRFQASYRTRQCPPTLLDTLGDFRTPRCTLDATSSQPSQQLLTSNEDDPELKSALHLDKMFPAFINIHIEGYTTFNISQELRQNASQAHKKQEVCNKIKRKTTCISQYEWSDRFHLPIANQAIDDLVHAGILNQTDVLRQKAYLRHRGHLRVETHSLQIIIPTTSPEEFSYVSLSSSELSTSKFEHRIVWRADRGLLLRRGTMLSTEGNIFFISIVMPLSPEQE